jgi:hypothetical protein
MMDLTTVCDIYSFFGFLPRISISMSLSEENLSVGFGALYGPLPLPATALGALQVVNAYKGIVNLQNSRPGR